MSKARRQNLPGGRRAGSRHQRTFATDTGNPLHETRGGNTERDDMLADEHVLELVRNALHHACEEHLEDA